ALRFFIVTKNRINCKIVLGNIAKPIDKILCEPNDMFDPNFNHKKIAININKLGKKKARIFSLFISLKGL
ncbi:hypothetical protein, partial [Aquimarina sp. AD1]|uniref:hypothetical protein n=1 Tax=Aquimarina sp. (strain AD1) TaxID=1714848 RepID=UPI001F3921C5